MKMVGDTTVHIEGIKKLFINLKLEIQDQTLSGYYSGSLYHFIPRLEQRCIDHVVQAHPVRLSHFTRAGSIGRENND